MRETLVIVDDNDAFRTRARMLLDAEGYDVVGEAADGAHGLRVLRELRPDVALLDVQLPDTDGFALTERLRDEQASTRIIIISTREASDYTCAVTRCGRSGSSRSPSCAARPCGKSPRPVDDRGLAQARQAGVTAPNAEPARSVLAAALDAVDEAVILIADGRPIHLNAAAAARTRISGELPSDLTVLASTAPDGGETGEIIVVAAQTLNEALTAPDENAESRRQLNQAQSVARVGSWTADMIHRRVEFSDEQYRLYGIEPQSRPVDIRTFLGLIHPDDRPEMAAAVDRAATEGVPFRLEHRLADEDSDVRWIEARCEAVLSAGRVVRMVGTCLDITERKAYEQSLRESLDEVRASRIRIVSAADEERRRVERDLHDGAQQRLVSLTMGLRLARSRLGADADPFVLSTLEEVSQELQLALSELRDLARGIHPAMLTEQGLAPALESLALRSPLPARILACPGERLPAALEIATFYLVAEALTNAIKHAHASHASISVSIHGDRVVVEVSDDGVGGASLVGGTGLRGLADRVAALDGRLSVDSPPGTGTTLTAELPCG